MTWLRFASAIAPDLWKYGRALFERYGGDLTAARVEIAQIRDHGARLVAGRAEIDRRMAEEDRRRDERGE